MQNNEQLEALLNESFALSKQLKQKLRDGAQKDAKEISERLDYLVTEIKRLSPMAEEDIKSQIKEIKQRNTFINIAIGSVVFIIVFFIALSLL